MCVIFTQNIVISLRGFTWRLPVACIHFTICLFPFLRDIRECLFANHFHFQYTIRGIDLLGGLIHEKNTSTAAVLS